MRGWLRFYQRTSGTPIRYREPFIKNYLFQFQILCCWLVGFLIIQFFSFSSFRIWKREEIGLRDLKLHQASSFTLAQSISAQHCFLPSVCMTGLKGEIKKRIGVKGGKLRVCTCSYNVIFPDAAAASFFFEREKNIHLVRNECDGL